MGCDIHPHVEVKVDDKWEISTEEVFSLDSFDRDYYKKEKSSEPFDWRSYSMFGFLAGVRNYDHCIPISEPKGLPDDCSEEIKEAYEDYSSDAHSCSYLTLRELSEFDYNKEFWNRRIFKPTYNADGSTSGGNGASLAEEGEGKIITYRENLGEWYFRHLEEMRELGESDDVRIVFWFDN